MMGWESWLVLSFPLYSVFLFLTGEWLALSGYSILCLANKQMAVMALLFWGCEFFIGTAHGGVLWNIGVVLGVPVWLIIGNEVVLRCAGRRWFDELKRISYFVFASHIIICPIVSHVVAKICPQWSYGRFTFLALSYFVVGIGLCRGVFWLLERMMPPAARVLNGEL